MLNFFLEMGCFVIKRRRGDAHIATRAGREIITGWMAGLATVIAITMEHS